MLYYNSIILPYSILLRVYKPINTAAYVKQAAMTLVTFGILAALGFYVGFTFC